jgi:hypothetical protein
MENRNCARVWRWTAGIGSAKMTRRKDVGNCGDNYIGGWEVCFGSFSFSFYVNAPGRVSNLPGFSISITC